MAAQKSPQLKELVMALDEVLPQAFLTIHASRWHLIGTALLTMHPFYELSLCDLHMTATKRAKIVVDCILGSLSFVALFFSVDGTAVAARSPSECPLQQGTLVWYLFVAFFSVLLSFVPRSLELYLARRNFVPETRDQTRQLRTRRRRDAGFWVFSTCLALLYLLVITAFLANLSEADEWKWMFTFWVVLLRKLFIVPVLACLVSWLGSVAVGTAPRPPKKFGLDFSSLCEGEGEGGQKSEGQGGVWAAKVQELLGSCYGI